jgi:proline iminopeptidase
LRILKLIGWAILGLVLAAAATVGLVYATTDAEFDVPATVTDEPALPRIEVAGSILHGETFGHPDSPVLIALHGGPGGDYRSILPLRALSDTYFVVFYDQRGSGLSPRLPPDQLKLSDFISELDTLVDHFGNGQPVSLVGHSWGAMLATAYLSAHREKVEHLVLVEPGILTADAARAFVEATAPPKSLELYWRVGRTIVESWHVGGPDQQARADYRMKKLSTLDIADNPALRFFCGSEIGKVESWRYGQLAQTTLLGEAFDQNGELTANFIQGIEGHARPVLFLTGACSEIIGAEHQRLYHTSLFPSAELIVIQEAGHELFADQPEATVAAIRAYLGEPLQAPSN